MRVLERDFLPCLIMITDGRYKEESLLLKNHSSMEIASPKTAGEAIFCVCMISRDEMEKMILYKRQTHLMSCFVPELRSCRGQMAFLTIDDVDRPVVAQHPTVLSAHEHSKSFLYPGSFLYRHE